MILWPNSCTPHLEKVLWSMAFAHHGVAPSPPPPAPRLHGERIISGVALEDACRIGSTPPSRLITVLGVVEEPSVATIINASPFIKSESEAAGMRAIIC